MKTTGTFRHKSNFMQSRKQKIYLLKKVQEFAKNEGIELEASFLNENNILARLQLLTKSDYKRLFARPCLLT